MTAYGLYPLYPSLERWQQFGKVSLDDGPLDKATGREDYGAIELDPAVELGLGAIANNPSGHHPRDVKLRRVRHPVGDREVDKDIPLEYDCSPQEL